MLLHVDIQLSKHRLLKRLLFPPFNYHSTLVKKSIDHKRKSLFLDSNSVPLICMSVLMPRRCGLDHHSFVVKF